MKETTQILPGSSRVLGMPLKPLKSGRIFQRQNFSLSLKGKEKARLKLRRHLA